MKTKTTQAVKRTPPKRTTQATTETTREFLDLKLSMLQSRFQVLEQTTRQAGALLTQVKEQVEGTVYEHAPPYTVKKRQR